MTGRIETVGAVGYPADASGNLTNRGTDTFAYDQANRLKSVTIGGAARMHTYDGDGKRANKTIGTRVSPKLAHSRRERGEG